MPGEFLGEDYPIVHQEKIPISEPNNPILRIPFLRNVVYGSPQRRALEQFTDKVNAGVREQVVPELHLTPGDWEIFFSRIRGSRTQIVVLDKSPEAFRRCVEYYLSASQVYEGHVSIEVRKVNPQLLPA